MPNANDFDNEAILDNFIDYAVIADANSKGGFASLEPTGTVGKKVHG